MKHDKNKKGKRLFNKEYKQLLNTLKNLWLRQHPLDRYWEVGRMLNELGGPAFYKVLIRKVITDTQINYTTLYNCRRFHSHWPTRTQLQGLIDNHVLWSHVLSLLQKWITDKERESLVRHIAKHRPTCTQFRDKVRDKVKAKKNVKR